MAYDKSLKFEHNLVPKDTKMGILGTNSAMWQQVVTNRIVLGPDSYGTSLPAASGYEEGSIFCLIEN